MFTIGKEYSVQNITLYFTAVAKGFYKHGRYGETFLLMKTLDRYDHQPNWCLARIEFYYTAKKMKACLSIGNLPGIGALMGSTRKIVLGLKDKTKFISA